MSDTALFGRKTGRFVFDMMGTPYTRYQYHIFISNGSANSFLTHDIKRVHETTIHLSIIAYVLNFIPNLIALRFHYFS